MQFTKASLIAICADVSSVLSIPFNKNGAGSVCASLLYTLKKY